MLPATINRDSAYADAQPPPKPVVMLVSATNLHLTNRRTLVMHQDLPAQFTPPAALEGAPVPPTPSPPQTVPGPSIHPTPALPAPATSSRHSSPLTNASDSDSDTGDDHPPKIAAPSAITRKILKNHAEWVEGDEKAEQITVNLSSLVLNSSHFSSEICSQSSPSRLGYKAGFQLPGYHRDARLLSQGKFSFLFLSSVDIYPAPQTQDKFPELKKYSKNWPVKCLLQAHLKSTASAAAKDLANLKNSKRGVRFVTLHSVQV